MRRAEEWRKKGAAAIKRDCIEFFNREGKKFNWKEDDLSELEVVNEQPKLVDPGVAEAPQSDEPKDELGGSSVVPEKPSYYTRAVAARRRAGLDVESAPRQSRGVEVRADDVIVINDEGEEAQGRRYTSPESSALVD